MSAARNGAAPLSRADRRELAALIARRGSLMHAAVACGVAVKTVMSARDGKPIMRRSREAITRALVLAAGGAS